MNLNLHVARVIMILNLHGARVIIILNFHGARVIIILNSLKGPISTCLAPAGAFHYEP